VVNLLVDIVRALVRASTSSSTSSANTPSRSASRPAVSHSAPNTQATWEGGQDYPGDYLPARDGLIKAEYSPNKDGDADPGEVVWTWVPFEEDYSQGKDRPVLVIGRDRSLGGDCLLALQLTSKDHDRDAAQEARAGRYWMDIGSGPWDTQGRPSEIRLNRIVRVDPACVRREGAIMPKKTFDKVIQAVASAPPPR
jgi:hypothetical protein